MNIVLDMRLEFYEIIYQSQSSLIHILRSHTNKLDYNIRTIGLTIAFCSFSIIVWMGDFLFLCIRKCFF